MTLDWKPSAGEQRILWWLKLIAAYPIGAGGFTYSLIRGDGVGMIASAILATSLDVGQVIAKTLKFTQSQLQAMEEAIDEQIEADKDRP